MPCIFVCSYIAVLMYCYGGVLVYSYAGVLVYCYDGVLVCWCMAMLVCWCIDVMECWSARCLQRCLDYFPCPSSECGGCRPLGRRQPSHTSQPRTRGQHSQRINDVSISQSWIFRVFFTVNSSSGRLLGRCRCSEASGRGGIILVHCTAQRCWSAGRDSGAESGDTGSIAWRPPDECD